MLERKEPCSKGNKGSARKVAFLGILVALAFVFSYVEFLIPVNLGVPGVKLGLANLVIIAALYTIGNKDAFLLSMVRILLVGITFGNLASTFYSLAGGILSLLVMILARRSNRLSEVGVSVLGGVFHNVGQILMAMLILETGSLVYYLPVLLISGILSGAVIGGMGALVIKRIGKLIQ